MKSEINPKIKEKIAKSSQPENVKEFLYEILELEYNHIDDNVSLKSEYHKAIQKYKGG